MANIVMGNLDGDLERIAFDTRDIKRVLYRKNANLVFSEEDAGLFLEIDGEVCPVKNISEKEKVGPYFIVLENGSAFNVSEYQLLFDVKELQNKMVFGIDAGGSEYLCKRHGFQPLSQPETQQESQPQPDSEEGIFTLDELDEKLSSGEITVEDLQELKTMIHRLKNGQFFEALTMEFSGKIKEIAQELIDFRKDIQRKIEPDIVEIASRDIPEASNQLEGINETLEKSTMKIMDINDEQLEQANKQAAILNGFISPNGNGKVDPQFWKKGRDLVNEMRRLLDNVPEEAKQICQFITPDLDETDKLFAEKGGLEAIKGKMSEPVATISDLLLDFGESDENLTKLNLLGQDLNNLLEEQADKAESVEEESIYPYNLEDASEMLNNQLEALKKLADLSLSMMEPLSFQDLVGQRIQKIIKLVKSMETRIEELIISFGIKLQKHKEDPEKSLEELDKDVEEYKMELKGPSRDGEGLAQSEVDQLLASL